MKKVQVGIDLGTTNTLVSTNRNGRIDIINIDGKKQMPSVLYVSEDGKEIIGKNALKKGKNLYRRPACRGAGPAHRRGGVQ